MQNELEITNISPLDGRYSGKVKELKSVFSEYALIKCRVYIEIEYFPDSSSLTSRSITHSASHAEKNIHKNMLKICLKYLQSIYNYFKW